MTQAERDAKRQARFDAMTDEAILADYERLERDLDQLTNGHVADVFTKCNSLRFLWCEAIKRGLDDRRKAIEQQVLKERDDAVMARIAAMRS